MVSNTSTEGHARLSIADCRAPSVLVSTGFGSGFFPVAPGTAGSVVALALWWFLLAPIEPFVQMVILAAACVASVLVVDHACRQRGVRDDQAIVLDEMIGMWITLWAAPRSAGLVGFGFLLFRLFDVLKPWPISWAERRLGGGLGVVMDDVFAGVLACAVLNLSVALARSLGVAIAA